MQKLHFHIQINASRQKVWETLIGKDTYYEWTKAFSPDPTWVSEVEGDWSKGSKMIFAATDNEGKKGGMVSTIAENKPNEFLSIKHIGILKDGVEDTESPEAREWSPAFENYTLKDSDGGTEFIVDIDLADEYVEMFKDMWPKALQDLKNLSEKND